jgi:hypothetical protein
MCSLSDYAFQAQTSNPIIRAEGSFDSVTGVTSESSEFPDGTVVPNDFSLQLNTNHFTAQTCAGGVKPPCQAWQQFIFSSEGTAFIQYWMYGVPCPSGWTAYGAGCWWNSDNGVGVSALTIADLAQLNLMAGTSGGYDTIVVWKGITKLGAASQPTVFNLHQYCC